MADPQDPDAPVENAGAGAPAPEPDLDDDPDLRTGTFNPAVMDRTVIAVPLLMALREERRRRASEPGYSPTHSVIIDLNDDYRGSKSVRAVVKELVAHAIENRGLGRPQGIDEPKSRLSDQYVFATLEGPVIEELVRLDNLGHPEVAPDQPGALTGHRTIHSIWPDFPVTPLLTRSVITVKADAARAAFSAVGTEIVWAVMDSGVDRRHPHFARHENLKLTGRLARAHHDFTGSQGGALTDMFGHGTHVAGIVAGDMEAPAPPGTGPPPTARTPAPRQIFAFTRQRDEQGRITTAKIALDRITGVAPRCKLVSLKVLDDAGNGAASNLIVAIEHIQRLNNYGRRLIVHGVNMSVGYNYEPEWFACGQSPLCVEVNRLVKSGVVLVAAAGNTGYGWLQAAFKKEPVAAGMDLSINDPGNAEHAITVGSTHRENPHTYGVSYFSSKGPTGDGRLKPDLVAPGEKILSCGAGEKLTQVGGASGDAMYVENSGTSMAAPHVSGAIAAFLSVRREFIGQPEAVKALFCSTATDLKRDRNFQGAGLLDLMRAIQSI